MARKEYAGGAAETTLASSITNVSTSITLTDATNWPTGATGNFWIKIGVGLANEEKIKCQSRSGNVLTVATGGRGGDGTTAIAHDPPEIVTHEGVAEDFNEANEHINNAALDHHTNYLNTARHDTTARHTFGAVIPVGSSASASAPGNAASGGVANSASRSDHVHAREGFGSPVASNPGDTSSAGGASTVARSDHRHAREAASGGTPLTYGSPAASNVGDPTSDGVATSVARSDHQHAREAFGGITLENTFTAGKSDGVATTVARSDHRHGNPSMSTALASETTSPQTTTSTSYADLAGDPSLTVDVPITGAVLVAVGGCVFNSGNNVTLISFRASGANVLAGVDYRAFGTNGVESMRGSRVTLLLGLSAGSTTFKTVERVDGGTGSFIERQLMVWPLR